jgi:hypothetical protein
MNALPAFVLAVVGACVGCNGTIGDPERDDGTSTVPEEMRTGASALRRLTRIEYERSLRDLVGDAAVDAAGAALTGLPDDHVDKGFSTMALGVSSPHLDGYLAVADRIAGFLVADATRLGALEGCLASAAGDDACVKGFIERFGRRVYRRPVTQEEQASLMASYASGKSVSTSDGVAFVLMHMLQAAPFLYRFELGGDLLPDAPDTYALTAWELATRLSYFAWGSTPDDELLAAADSGTLSDDDELDAQVERLFADPRAVERVRWFFVEWLGVDRIPQAEQSDAFLAGIAKATLADDMRAELQAFVTHQVFEAGGAYDELMTSSESFVFSDALAEVYGVATPSAKDGHLTFQDGRRSGLLTRAGMLAGKGEETHPIQRGAFIARRFLCDPIVPPDPNDFPPNTIVPPEFDPDKTAIERWTEKTSASQCAGCHGRINGLGFALENYDTIGRWRDTEPIIDPDTGLVVNELPIDASAEVMLDETPVPVAGAVGLGQAMAVSGRAKRCFATQWFRFTQGRSEASDDDGLIDELSAAGSGPDGAMIAMFKSLARAPQFRLRKIIP